jgi:large repetitive protein
MTMVMTVRGVIAAVFGLLVAATAAAQSSDMFVTKNAPATANVGSNVTYTISVSNGGPDPAPNASFTDNLPGGATFVSYQQNTGPTFTCTLPNVGDAGGTATCSVATLNAGTTATFTIVVNVSASAAGTTLINSISVTSNNPDPNPENNSSVTGTSVPGGNQADVSILKTGPGSAPPNSNVTYTITVSNSGPNAAQNVSWSDTLPAGTPPSQMTFVSFNQTGGPTFNCGVPSTTTTCTIASLAVGATATFQLVGHIPNGTASATTYTNVVTVTSANDPNSENDTSSTSLTVSSVDVGVTKTGPASAVAGGPTYNYVITLTNGGPDTAADVSFTDPLPSGLTFVSLMQNTGPSATCNTPAPNNGGTVTCSISLLPNGGSAQFTLTVQPLASIPNNTIIMNTATATTSSADTNSSNNSSTASTTITAQADLAVVKSGAATATAGTNLTYTITANNNGPSDAQSVVVNDVLPATETFVSLNAPGYTCTTPAVGATGTVNCTRTTLIAGATTSLTLVVRIAPSATGTIANTVTITSSTTDNNPNNNSSTASTNVSASADVAVTKGAAASPAVNQVAFTVMVTNNGPSNATTVTMTDNTPAGTTFVSEAQNSGPSFVCTNPAVGGTGTTSCSIGTLVPGASATFTLVYQPTASSPAPIANTANVTATTPDPNPANNSATASSTPGNTVPAATPLVLAALAFALAAMGMVILRR